MGSKNNDALFYTCSLIEYIGRNVKRRRKEVTDFLGKELGESMNMRMFFTANLLQKQRMSL